MKVLHVVLEVQSMKLTSMKTAMSNIMFWLKHVLCKVFWHGLLVKSDSYS